MRRLSAPVFLQNLSIFGSLCVKRNLPTHMNHMIFSHENFPAPIHIIETGHHAPKRTIYGAALLATALLMIVSKLLIVLLQSKSSISFHSQKVFNCGVRN
jgi:hypothetical protein